MMAANMVHEPFGDFSIVPGQNIPAIQNTKLHMTLPCGLHWYCSFQPYNIETFLGGISRPLRVLLSSLTHHVRIIFLFSAEGQGEGFLGLKVASGCTGGYLLSV